MTTIYSNNKDIDSEILKELFKDIPDNNIMELTYDIKLTDWMDKVEELVKKEDDTLILCGHGSPNGLYFPGFEDYIIHDMYAEIIKARRVICSWCYASSFVVQNNIKNCLATGMFISNLKEAQDNFCFNSTQDDINLTDSRIYQEIGALIKSNVPIDEWKMKIGVHTDFENEVDFFNRQGIIFRR